VWTKPHFRVKILRLKCTQFDFGYSAPPDSLGGLLVRVGEGKGGEEKRGKGKGRKRRR